MNDSTQEQDFTVGEEYWAADIDWIGDEPTASVYKVVIVGYSETRTKYFGEGWTDGLDTASVPDYVEYNYIAKKVVDGVMEDTHVDTYCEKFKTKEAAWASVIDAFERMAERSARRSEEEQDAAARFEKVAATIRRAQGLEEQ